MKVFVLLSLVAVAYSRIEDDYETKLRALQNPDLYDGDIAGIDGPHDAERNAIVGTYYRWPGAVVPYVIDSSLEDHFEIISQAFEDYHDNTCIQFVPRTDEEDYINIFSGQGCYSLVGRSGPQQPLSLDTRGCLHVGTIIHELGHAIGFYHEQSRSDRDNYLNIYLENVVNGMEGNFEKLAPNRNILYNSFDYDSIMIYGNDAFSKDGAITMEAKNGQKLTNPFEKKRMSKSDIERVNKFYNCWV